MHYKFFQVYCQFPIKLFVFIHVGLLLFLHLWHILLDVEISSVARPGLTTEEISAPNMTCQRFHRNDERPTGTNTINLMGRK